MCGILGFNFSNSQLLEKGMQALQHRGPDAAGLFEDNYISLGHRRLSIIDLSENAKQPMERLHYVIIFNGEIYNFQEINKELSEYKFQSSSDTETIIYAYDKWKEDCVKRFNGVFSFCIYDKQNKTLFVARDRLGEKPLYYICQENQFIFASELNILLPFLKKREIDPQGLSQYFTFRFTLGETTLAKNVLKFLPGHYMLYDLNESAITAYKKYYSIPPVQVKKGNLKYFIEELKKRLENSVKLRMVSDVPVAVLLSGGIDSSVITSLARKYNSNLNTFSIGFDTNSELPYAKLVAETLGTHHHEFILHKESVLEYLDDFIRYMDEPVGDAGYFPVFVLAKCAREFNKVVLTGDGGDEILVGYDRYKMFHYGRKIRPLLLFDFKQEILRRLVKTRKLGDYQAFFEIIRLFEVDELKKMNVPEFDGSQFWRNIFRTPLLNAEVFDIETLLPGDFFMKADKMSSAFGLEDRDPFMDTEFVEFALSIPMKYKLRGWTEKYILKKAFSDVLPPQITRRRKSGLNSPVDYWFKNVLKDKFVEILKRNDHNLYDKTYVLQLLEKLQRTGENYKLNFMLSQKLWSIFVFEMWYDKFILMHA